MFKYNSKKMYYAYKGNSKCLTSSKSTLNKFLYDNRVKTLYELYVSNNLDVSEGKEVNFVIIKSNNEIVRLEVFDINDCGIHETISEMANSLYTNGSYKIIKLKLK